ncbi:hypothetical protein [Nocardia sp. NPDC002869]|uniref:hypothetical protein n=1 Tax=Nocardia sp. NPDC002869 TaxID=3161032 RepID=UPI00398D0D9F
MMLGQYEQWFAQAGLAVVAFDFRHLGESGGEPRQLVSQRRYAEDRVAARAPQAVLTTYDADHFTVYHPPVVEQIAADQIAFLTAHLM